MAKKTGHFKMNRNGSLVYSTEEGVLKRIYAPCSKFEHSLAGLVILVICATIDFTLFYQMFSKILYDSPAMMIISIAAMIVGFDYGPIYLGIQWKRYRQGYKVDQMMSYGLMAAFVIAFAANFIMRIVIRDLALPDLSADTASIIGGTVTESVKNPVAPAFSLLVAVMPLVTSIVSFVVSNTTYNPLLKEKQRLEESMLMLENDITDTESILAEYESDRDMLERMVIDDDNRYESATGVVYSRAKLYGDYVRERIKEHMGEAAATNELSASTRDGLLSRLDEIVQMYRVDPENRVIQRMTEDRKTGVQEINTDNSEMMAGLKA